MSFKKIFLGAFSILACFSLLLAADFWEEKPWTEWDKDDALELLQDSPWAEVYTIRGAGSSMSVLGPGSAGDLTSAAPSERETGRGQASRIYYLRFQSAKPVRMAVARLQTDGGEVSGEVGARLQEFVDTHPAPGHVVLVLRIQQGMDATALKAATTDLLKNNAYLLLKKSKKRIYVKQYVPPKDNLEAIFVFDRMENGEDLFTVEEDEVRAIIEIDRQTKINQKFELKDMVFEGQVEI